MLSWDQLALLHMAGGFHVFLVTFGVDNIERVNRFTHKTEDNVIQAFMIMGFVFFTVAFMFELVRNFSTFRDKKIYNICSIILAALAVVCVIIGISVYADKADEHEYRMTTYAVSVIMATLSALFLSLGLCQ